MSYRSILLAANQKDFILSVTDMIVNILRVIVQCIIIWITKNYLCYLIIEIISVLLRNAVLYRIVGNQYPYIRSSKNIKADANEKKELLANVKAMFAVKIAGIVINNTDNILVSWVNTLMVGLCSNYLTISNQIKTMVSVLQQSLMHSLGISSAQKDTDEKYYLFNEILLLNIFIAGIICVPLGVLWDNFIVMWLGSEYIIDRLVVWALLLNFCWYIISATVWMFRDTNGLFIYVRKVLLINTILNIFLSVISGKIIGVAGVYISTVLSNLATDFWYDSNLIFRKLFNKNNSYLYQIKVLSNTAAIFILIFVITAITKNWQINIATFILKGILSGLVFTVYFVLLNRKKREFSGLLEITSILLTKMGMKAGGYLKR